MPETVVQRRPLWLSACLFLVTLLAGLAVRFAPLGLPWVVRKYGGSGLWAVLLYWLISTLLPRMRVVRVAAITGIAATCVEWLKLYHTPGLDAFRLTLPGVLLLGREFSQTDVVVYWLAIACAAITDGWLPKRSTHLSRREHAEGGALGAK